MTRADIIAQVREAQGLNTTPPSDWTYEQRTAYNKALASELLKYPELSSPAVLAIAEKVQTTPTQALDDYTLLEAAGDFMGEVANQAEEINPLSERNRGKTALMIVGVLLVGAAVFAWAKAGAPIPGAASKGGAAA